MQRDLIFENVTRMESFPYSWTELEYKELYDELIEEHEMEISMWRTRRNRDFHQMSFYEFYGWVINKQKG